MASVVDLVTQSGIAQTQKQPANTTGGVLSFDGAEKERFCQPLPRKLSYRTKYIHDDATPHDPVEVFVRKNTDKAQNNLQKSKIHPLIQIGDHRTVYQPRFVSHPKKYPQIVKEHRKHANSSLSVQTKKPRPLPILPLFKGVESSLTMSNIHPTSRDDDFVIPALDINPISQSVPATSTMLSPVLVDSKNNGQSKTNYIVFNELPPPQIVFQDFSFASLKQHLPVAVVDAEKLSKNEDNDFNDEEDTDF